jgi:hypothetical protein
MAVTYTKCRTNYFSVTDYDKFSEIIESCESSDDIVIIEDDDQEKYGFYCEGEILGLMDPSVSSDAAGEDDSEEDDDSDVSYDLFCESLQSILPEGEAIILIEIGHTKMASLHGYCSVITKNETKGIDLCTMALEAARNMLGNPEYDTKMYG